MEVEVRSAARAKEDVVKLWEGFLARLVDQALIVISTKEVEPETEMALRTIKEAIFRTYKLLLTLLGRDSRIIFFEREFVIAQQIFRLLRNYNHRYQDRLSRLTFELRNLAKHRNRLQA